VQDWANSDSATGDFGMNFEVFPDAGQGAWRKCPSPCQTLSTYAGQLKWQITGVYHGDSNDFDNRIRSLTDALGPTGDQDVQRNIGWIDSLIVNAGQSSLDVSGAADSTDAFYARSVVVQEMTSAAATNLAYFLSYDCSGYNGNNGNLWYFLQVRPLPCLAPWHPLIRSHSFTSSEAPARLTALSPRTRLPTRAAMPSGWVRPTSRTTRATPSRKTVSSTRFPQRLLCMI
jgi:hypothetical protein